MQEDRNNVRTLLPECGKDRRATPRWCGRHTFRESWGSSAGKKHTSAGHLMREANSTDSTPMANEATVLAGMMCIPPKSGSVSTYRIAWPAAAIRAKSDMHIGACC